MLGRLERGWEGKKGSLEALESCRRAGQAGDGWAAPGRGFRKSPLRRSDWLRRRARCRPGAEGRGLRRAAKRPPPRLRLTEAAPAGAAASVPGPAALRRPDTLR